MLGYNNFLEEPLKPYIYKLDKAPPVIKKVLDELSWVEFDERVHDQD